MEAPCVLFLESSTEPSGIGIVGFFIFMFLQETPARVLCESLNPGHLPRQVVDIGFSLEGLDPNQVFGFWV